MIDIGPYKNSFNIKIPNTLSDAYKYLLKQINNSILTIIMIHDEYS